MTNWEKEKKYFDTVGIDRYDVPDNIINYLKQKPSKLVHNELIGHIKEEFGYQNVPDYVQKYFLEKTQSEFMQSHMGEVKVLDTPLPLKLDTLWINYQKKYEYNPIHEHSGVFSFIVFLQIPYNLEDEDKHFGIKFNNKDVPHNSKLGFLTNLNGGRIWAKTICVDKSFENKMLMFPAWYKHYVYPFYTSDDYRITVSGNICLRVPQKLDFK